MDFWTQLQQDYTLETLYAMLESDAEQYGSWILEDFEALVRTAVSRPTGERGSDSVCRYHEMLCEVLEPGDYIIDLNWDSVMADALLYTSHFWFPASGFGLPLLYSPSKLGQKAARVDSFVYLFHVHGSVVLFELEKPQLRERRSLALYVGPNQYTPIGGVLSLPDQDSKEDREKINHGCIFLDGRWFHPIFVPPSKYKKA